MVAVDISDKLYSEIEKRVKESEEFESVGGYITFVLEELLKDEEEEEYSLSEEDEEKVKTRARIPLDCFHKNFIYLLKILEVCIWGIVRF